ncbi:hypothetical protein O3M35_001342 [Rhynocoris fuscipes]|uniref:RNA polymerase I-specific transcription initiation factor RRN3 n=1 Tax=Rhynocoris fuscipes TaxID=488301 RepID=A0AAW1DRS4_9HEMI
MSILSSSRLDLQSPVKAKAVRFQLDYNLKSLLLDFVSEKDRHLYEELLCRIRSVGQEIRDDDLTQLLKEARGCISILDTNFRLFVQVVLILRWAHRSTEVVEEYKGFLQELCLAHNYYTKQVIDHLVTCFKTDNELWEDCEPNDESIKSIKNIHHVIESILSLIPMSKEILIASLKKNYPYIKKPSHEHEVYVYNMLLITNYHPAIREDIFNILISKLIILDAQVPRSELESAMQVDDTEVFEIDDNNGVETDAEKNPIAHSLDVSLTLIFRHIRLHCFPDSTNLDWDRTKTLYSTLIKVFETVILPTHGINHVQFLMFYLVSFKPALSISFLQTLWKKVINPSEAPFIRHTSVFYIASILSRAKYISVSVVQEMLTEMSKWTQSYIAGQEDNLCFDIRLHLVFYTTCQAMFYVIAFRYKELVEGKGLVLLQGLNLSKIVTCRLNPLRACVPVVATHFASVARKFQLAYCYTIMEHNARSTLPQVPADTNGTSSIALQTQLDAFFPFDPYLLPRSYEFIEPIYREYCGSIEEAGAGGVRSLGGGEEEADEDNDDDFLDSSEIGHQQQQMACSPNFSYSTSPGFLQMNTH